MRHLKKHLPFLAFMAVVIAVEIGCARLAWYTVHERVSQTLMMLVGLNVFPIYIYRLSQKKPAVGLALLGLFLSVPTQLFLGYQWRLLHTETLNVAAYAEQVKKQTGSYPLTLTNYRFIHPSIQGDLKYKRYRADDCEVRFHLGSDSTEHSYSNGDGWWYSPD
ncbi:hypothetical protein EON80_21890 [bacterium]|nr:MAG: hypothetical protein EON80_21890 [bacterium]